MEKLQSTARKLDIFFQILQICCTVAIVASIVVLMMIGACFAFKLDPEMIGTGYEVIEIGAIELELAQGYAPDKHQVLIVSAVGMVLDIAVILLAYACLKAIRSLLQPMKEGSPFHESASACLKKLALLILGVGVLVNAADLLGLLLMEKGYGLSRILLGENILRVTFHYELNLSWFAVSAILLLLSYIFHYGQALQQLSDETL